MAPALLSSSRSCFTSRQRAGTGVSPLLPCPRFPVSPWGRVSGLHLERPPSLHPDPPPVPWRARLDTGRGGGGAGSAALAGSEDDDPERSPGPALGLMPVTLGSAGSVNRSRSPCSRPGVMAWQFAAEPGRFPSSPRASHSEMTGSISCLSPRLSQPEKVAFPVALPPSPLPGAGSSGQWPLFGGTGSRPGRS